MKSQAVIMGLSPPPLPIQALAAAPSVGLAPSLRRLITNGFPVTVSEWVFCDFAWQMSTKSGLVKGC